MTAVFADAGALLGLLILGVVVAIAVVAYNQRRCPHCGFERNKWKSVNPVCQRCGRDRTGQ